jgi:hypothetical protein
MKDAANRPEERAERSNRARAQVLRQGGVPNAVKITPENWQEKTRNRVYRDATFDERLKMRESARKGPAHHNWKGGVTSPENKIRTSFEYKEWRRQVFERDGRACVLCGKSGGQMHADHIKTFADFPELRLVLSNGRTLCPPCHFKTETHGGTGRGKICADTVRRIRALLSEGRTQYEVAEEIGIHQTTVSQVARRKTWAHVS